MWLLESNVVVAKCDGERSVGLVLGRLWVEQWEVQVSTCAKKSFGRQDSVL